MQNKTKQKTGSLTTIDSPDTDIIGLCEQTELESVCGCHNGSQVL